jgi:hypothetical protein
VEGTRSGWVYFGTRKKVCAAPGVKDTLITCQYKLMHPMDVVQESLDLLVGNADLLDARRM